MASQVLEAHILATLTQATQHLILVGKSHANGRRSYKCHLVFPLRVPLSTVLYLQRGLNCSGLRNGRRILRCSSAVHICCCGRSLRFYLYLRSMGLNVLSYQPHLLQRCYHHPACGHEGSSHLSPVLALWNFNAIQLQHSTPRFPLREPKHKFSLLLESNARLLR